MQETAENLIFLIMVLHINTGFSDSFLLCHSPIVTHQLLLGCSKQMSVHLKMVYVGGV